MGTDCPASPCEHLPAHGCAAAALRPRADDRLVRAWTLGTAAGARRAATLEPVIPQRCGRRSRRAREVTAGEDAAMNKPPECSDSIQRPPRGNPPPAASAPTRWSATPPASDLISRPRLEER